MPVETEGEKYMEGKTKCKDIKMSPAIRFEAAILSPLHLKLGVLLELVPLLHQHELFLTNESEISNRFNLEPSCASCAVRERCCGPCHTPPFLWLSWHFLTRKAVPSSKAMLPVGKFSERVILFALAFCIE